MLCGKVRDCEASQLLTAGTYQLQVCGDENYASRYTQQQLKTKKEAVFEINSALRLTINTTTDENIRISDIESMNTERAL